MAFLSQPTITTPAIIFCSSFHCDWECRKSLRPPFVRLRFGLWLPILRNSVQHLTMPHFPFSSSGSRPRWGDFNPQWDMFFLSPMSCLFIFLSCASRHAAVQTVGFTAHVVLHEIAFVEYPEQGGLIPLECGMLDVVFRAS